MYVCNTNTCTHNGIKKMRTSSHSLTHFHSHTPHLTLLSSISHTHTLSCLSMFCDKKSLGFVGFSGIRFRVCSVVPIPYRSTANERTNDTQSENGQYRNDPFATVPHSILSSIAFCTQIELWKTLCAIAFQCAHTLYQHHHHFLSLRAFCSPSRSLSLCACVCVCAGESVWMCTFKFYTYVHTVYIIFRFGLLLLLLGGLCVWLCAVLCFELRASTDILANVFSSAYHTLSHIAYDAPPYVHNGMAWHGYPVPLPLALILSLSTFCPRSVFGEHAYLNMIYLIFFCFPCSLFIRTSEKTSKLECMKPPHRGRERERAREWQRVSAPGIFKCSTLTRKSVPRFSRNQSTSSSSSPSPLRIPWCDVMWCAYS